jgi:hypothetical protein
MDGSNGCICECISCCWAIYLEMARMAFVYLSLQYWGLSSGPTPWATPPAPFCEGSFQDRVLRTVCLGWLLISASWVAGITGVSHQCLARMFYITHILSQYFKKSTQTHTHTDTCTHTLV